MDPTGEDLTPVLDRRTDAVFQGRTTAGISQDHQRSQQREGQQQTHHQELLVWGQQGQGHQEIRESTAAAGPPPDALPGNADLNGERHQDRVTAEDALVSHLGEQDPLEGRPEDLVLGGGASREHQNRTLV